MKFNITLGILVSLTLLVGCNGKQPPTGRQVTVQFNRSSLGHASNAISLTTDRINGVKVSMSGTLSVVNADWIMLKNREKDHWIPRHNVLLIRVDD